jgi:hypothetical protein
MVSAAVIAVRYPSTNVIPLAPAGEGAATM